MKLLDGWYFLNAEDEKPVGPFASPKMAEDAALGRVFAFDKSVRSFDIDKRLHVEVVNISKANVCPYRGAEIPDADTLGLQPDKIYQLFRAPEELEKAAATANNLQLLMEHVAVDATDHKPDITVGSTGTDARFDGTYVKNSLVVWAKDAIDKIEDGSQKELSSAYRYRADMTPGEFKGTPYDGIMRDIIFNHVALVKEGRAGADVVVGDSALTKETYMSKVVLSRKAVLLGGALTGYLMPKLAKDAKFDVSAVLKDVTAKNFGEKKAGVITEIKKTVKLAKDANLDDLHNFIDRMDKETVAEGADADPESGAPMDEEAMKKKAADAKKAAQDAQNNFLKEKLSAEDMATYDSMCAKTGEDEFPPKKEEEEEPAKDEFPEKKPEGITAKAMDAALKAAETNTEKRVMQKMRDIQAASDHVASKVGKLAIAQDSAEGVYRTALGALGAKVDGLNTLPLSALKAIFDAQPNPNEKPQRIATDTALANDGGFSDRWGGAVGRIGRA